MTIFNIDTFRIGLSLPPANGDGCLEVFTGCGDNWSFVEEGADGKVVRVTEKVPISELCCTGLYHFARADDFLWALARERLVRSGAQRELYVAPLYNHLIGKGADIRARHVSREDIVFCGVPAEYEAIVGDPRLSRRLERMALASDFARQDSGGRGCRGRLARVQMLTASSNLQSTPLAVRRILQSRGKAWLAPVAVE